MTTNYINKKTEKRKNGKTLYWFFSSFVFGFFGLAIIIASAATFDSDVLPSKNNTYNLGFPTLRWQDLYLSRNLIVGGNLLAGSLIADPAGSNGTFYYNATLSSFRAYQGGSWNDLGLWNFSSATNQIYNSNSGKVGINTPNPSQKLEVSGTIRAKGFLLPTGANNGYLLTSDSNGAGTWRAPAVSLWLPNGNHIYNSNNGNVGIGNSNPQEKLHISNGTLIIDNSANPSILGASIATAKINNLTTTSMTVTENLDLDITNNLQIGNSLSAGRGGIFSNGEISSSDYLKFGKINSGPPVSEDCNSDSERGRITMDTNSNLLYICNGATRGWDNLSLFD
ncbi:MAG: hypothetical protein HZB99_00580 [Candidatus Harrisonbacteria bacterium]|nr:hypothetical protein [Candidatus Harrisonbacteria bacterium]